VLLDVVVEVLQVQSLQLLVVDLLHHSLEVPLVLLSLHPIEVLLQVVVRVLLIRHLLDLHRLTGNLSFHFGEVKTSCYFTALIVTVWNVEVLGFYVNGLL